MIEIDCDQGSPEWQKIRCGIPTTSNYAKIITTKGEPSKQRKKYLYELAAERISGIKTPTYQSWQMKHGIEQEPRGRLEYEIYHGVEVRQVGFCFQDEKRLWGHSPDGLVDPDGEIELKHAEPHIQVERLLNGYSGHEHYQQLMGGLFITGRKWIDLMSFSEGLPPIINRFYLDRDFRIKLKVVLTEFVEELDEVANKLKKL